MRGSSRSTALLPHAIALCAMPPGSGFAFAVDCGACPPRRSRCVPTCSASCTGRGRVTDRGRPFSWPCTGPPPWPRGGSRRLGIRGPRTSPVRRCTCWRRHRCTASACSPTRPSTARCRAAARSTPSAGPSAPGRCCRTTRPTGSCTWRTTTSSAARATGQLTPPHPSEPDRFLMCLAKFSHSADLNRPRGATVLLAYNNGRGELSSGRGRSPLA